MSAATCCLKTPFPIRLLTRRMKYGRCGACRKRWTTGWKRGFNRRKGKPKEHRLPGFYKQLKVLKLTPIRARSPLLLVSLIGRFQPFIHLARSCTARFWLVPLLTPVFGNIILVQIIISNHPSLQTSLSKH